MRLAHVTDIHFTDVPPLRRLWGKRLLGTANLFLGGRRHAFPVDVKQRLVDQLIALAPDAVFITGDLTGSALPEEFERARDFLRPVLDAFPSLVIAGNHDVYTRGAQREERIATYFGPWMGRADGAAVGRRDVGALTLLGLDPNRPGVLSSGRLPDEQLDELRRLLASDDLASQTVVLGLHYPVVGPKGGLYDGWEHGLLNAAELVEVLRQAPKRPAAILFGHRHHGYAERLDLGDVAIPCFNCGSSGYALEPHRRRAAAMNLYELEGDEVEVTRYLDDGTRFTPEPGGAYATGR